MRASATPSPGASTCCTPWRAPRATRRGDGWWPHSWPRARAPTSWRIAAISSAPISRPPTSGPSSSSSRPSNTASATGRVASGGGATSGGVGPPRPARSPQGCESGERVTQHECAPPPDDRTWPSRAPRVTVASVVDMFARAGRGCAEIPHRSATRETRVMIGHRLRRITALFPVALLLVAGCGKDRAGQVLDEASRAGRTAASFPAADEDYFHDMDGGIPLSREEIQGRNTWIVWTGGNDRFWDTITVNSFGNFDLLKIVSSHASLKFSRDNRWNYLGLVNEPCFEKPTGPDPSATGSGSTSARRAALPIPSRTIGSIRGWSSERVARTSPRARSTATPRAS